MSTSEESSIQTNRTLEVDSDKDLVIQSLQESLQIHKEILERIQNEKDTFRQQAEKEKQEQKEAFDRWKSDAEQALEEEERHCIELEENIAALRKELEAKKEAYQQLEVNFYSYVKTIRVTDDDLSTIQPEISHLLSQLNNTCMGLKSKMDRKAGTEAVYRLFPDKKDFIQRYMTPMDGVMDASYITLFVEKYLIQMLLSHVMDVPIQLGVSINDAFQKLHDWMETRNKEWSNRLRQQVCALVIQQPGAEEEERIQKAKQELLERIITDLGDVYPSLRQDPKKIENLITRSLKLNLAVKGQEIKIERLPIIEDETQFDPASMKATAKGKSDGVVGLMITPPFVARDEIDNEHGFTVPGKVFCIESNNETIHDESIEEQDSQSEDKKEDKRQSMDTEDDE
ncbi:hypothetical protein RMATCC62417_14625 [Rhizopus microsporus]|nr:hypothetical protein RMATCC62417_14625 [Rhizopus microsporus]